MIFPSKPWPELGRVEKALCYVLGYMSYMRQEWRCKRGRHAGTELAGHCTACGKKIARGRGDRAPEGCMEVFG